MNVSDLRVLIAFLALLSLASTWRITPETIARLREEPPAPGDTVLFVDGHYEGVKSTPPSNNSDSASHNRFPAGLQNLIVLHFRLTTIGRLWNKIFASQGAPFLCSNSLNS